MQSTQNPAETVFENLRRQTAYIANQMSVAVAVLIQGELDVDSVAVEVMPENVRLIDIERFSQQWMNLIPGNADVKAALVHQFIEKYGLNPKQQPNTAKLLGISDAAVQEAYQKQYQESLEQALVKSDPLLEPRSPLSLDLSRLGIDLLQESLEYQLLPSGEALFRQGDPADRMYIVMSGRLEVLVGEGENTKKIAERGRFEILGDMALVMEEKRTATVIAMRDTELWHLSKSTFGELVQTSPQIPMQILRIVTRRLAESVNPKVNIDQISTMAVVPAGGGADITTFAHTLCDALLPLGNTLYLNRAKIYEQFGESKAMFNQDHPDHIYLMGWLNEQELLHQFVVYEADAELTDWTHICIRQADRILLAADPQASPELNIIENALFNSNEFSDRIRKILVFIHPDQNRLASRTSDWLAKRAVSAHYRVVNKDTKTAESLLRHLIGRPLGLVFSGGTVRGFFHIGVLRALEEAGFQVDVIGGTSSGSIVSALVAMGYNSHQIEEKMRTAFISGMRKLIDPTIPWTAFLSGRKVNQVLSELYEDCNIEDLWMPFYCTSVDITASEQILHTTGKLWEAIRCSIGVWPFLPPVNKDGHFIVDGAVFNNLPALEIQNLAPSAYIVASDVGDIFYPNDAQFNWGDDISVMKALNSLLNPFSKTKIPNGFALGIRQSDANGKYKVMASLPTIDVHIKPTLQDITPFDIKKVDILIQMGYQHATEALQNWDFPSQMFRDLR